MPNVDANGLSLAYESDGSADAVPLVLVAGLGRQLVSWPPALVARLVDRGLRVIRFDNRDVGLSTKFPDARAPSTLTMLVASAFRLPVKAPYTLYDMANDAAGLLDALGVKSAHFAGVSMGGMISQVLTAEHPDRVRSLTSISSTSGGPGLPSGGMATQRALFFSKPKSREREDLIAHGVHLWRALGSPDFPRSETELREAVIPEIERDWDLLAARRQTAAILSTFDRTRLLKRITRPALVIHGSKDPLIPLACGEDTAKRIAGSRLEVIEGMGHDLPAALHERLADAIADHALAAERGAERSR